MVRPRSRRTEVFTYMVGKVGQRSWCLTGDWNNEKRIAMGRSSEGAFLAEGTACANIWKGKRRRYIWGAKCLDGYNEVSKEESGKSRSQRSWPVIGAPETKKVGISLFIHQEATGSSPRCVRGHVCVCACACWKTPPPPAGCIIRNDLWEQSGQEEWTQKDLPRGVF